MGRQKEVVYYNDKYKGSLSDTECEMLEQIIDLDSINGSMNDLKHIIYELTDSDTTSLIEDMDYFGCVMKPINKKVGTLRDEQTLGTAFMYCARNCILGDSVGMGKTPQVAGLCRILDNIYTNNGKDFRYLLLTEKNLVNQTRFKMVKFTGDYAYELYGDAVNCKKFCARCPADEKLKYSVVGGHTLLTQNIFIDWLQQYSQGEYGSPFDLLVVDESSILGNSTNNIYKSLLSLMKLFKRVVFLNATPFESKLSIFYNQLNLLDSKLLPAKTKFDKEYVIYSYTGMFPKPTGKYKNAENFRRLVQYRYFARTRRDKGAVMEDCTSKVLVSPLSKVQKELLPTTQMPQLVYDCPNYLDSNIEFNDDNVPKLKSLRQVLEEDFEDAGSILIFVHYKEAQASLSEWLANMGYSNMILCGDTKQVDRNNIIKGFKNEEFKVLITNVQKGLDFGNCNYCIFYSFDPNPSKMVQFEGRITRSFDIVNKQVYKV